MRYFFMPPVLDGRQDELQRGTTFHSRKDYSWILVVLAD